MQEKKMSAEIYIINSALAQIQNTRSMLNEAIAFENFEPEQEAELKNAFEALQAAVEKLAGINKKLLKG